VVQQVVLFKEAKLSSNIDMDVIARSKIARLKRLQEFRIMSFAESY